MVCMGREREQGDLVRTGPPFPGRRLRSITTVPTFEVFQLGRRRVRTAARAFTKERRCEFQLTSFAVPSICNPAAALILGALIWLRERALTTGPAAIFIRLSLDSPNHAGRLPPRIGRREDRVQPCFEYESLP